MESGKGEIGSLFLNVPGSELNLLSTRIFLELEERLRALQTEKFKGLLIISDKPDNFVAGANIKEIADINTSQEGEQASRKAQAIFSKLASLPYPTLAVIHGPCLGGGLELALSCTYRVATDDPKTILSAPEVQLGLLPGATGSNRIPQLIGLRAAFNLMLTGKRLKADRAYKIGLVDAVIPSFDTARWGRFWLEKFLSGTTPPSRPKGFVSFLFDRNPLGKLLVRSMARKQVLKQSKGLYPAPLKIVEIAGRGSELEAKGFGELAVTPESKSLIHLFFTTTEVKNEWKAPSHPPRPIRQVGVIGAGLMGSGIASVLVEKEFSVRVKDVSLDSLGRTRRAVHDHLALAAKRKRQRFTFTPPGLDRLTTSTDFKGFGMADLIIEAVFEDLAIKRAVLKDFEAMANPEAIFASNTSTLPIKDIAAEAAHPERVIGMHFFSPVQKMPLVEVVVSQKTSPEVISTVVKLAHAMGKHVIVVNDAPGFYVNRPLGTYITEALKLFCEGASVESIDQTMEAFGFPVGPLKILDEVGWDIGHHVNGVLVNAYGERFKAPIDLGPMIKDKRMGRKSGKGFYLYDATKRGDRPVDPSVYEARPSKGEGKSFDTAVIQNRLMDAFLNEAKRCLDEGVLRSERDGDLGAVFGCGFPPQLGGPFWYLRHGSTRLTTNRI